MVQIAEPTSYQVAFFDPALRDDFNVGIREIRQNGTVERILAKYLTPFPSP